MDIRLSQVTRMYGGHSDRALHLPQVRALSQVDLVVASGERVGLMGASGSGKSTLLQVLGGLELADSGSVVVGGLDLSFLSSGSRRAFRRRVGFVFQRYNLIPTLSALDNVIVPVLPARTNYDKTARARELLAEVGLAEREQEAPGRLSGGQQQRVAVARALMGSPELVLADEPTGNLDSAAGTDVMDLLLRVTADRGATLVVATHDPSLAARCGRVVSLRDGAVMEDVQLEEPGDPALTLRRISGPRP